MRGVLPLLSLLTGLQAIIRWLLVGAIPGVVAGIVVGGGGSRIAMRIAGAMQGQVPRQLTDNEFTVGVSTVDGTIFLVLIGGTASGLVGGLLYMSVRPWLGASRRWRGPLFSAILLLPGGGLMIEAGNTDFSRIGSPTANILLFAALFILFGLLLAPLLEWIDIRLPSASSRRRLHTFGYPLLGVGYLVIAIPFAVISVFVFTGLIHDPVKIVIPALLISLIPISYIMGPSLQPSAPHRRPRIFLAGYGILAVACVLGLAFGVQAIIEIQNCADTLSTAARGFAPTEAMVLTLCE